MMVENEPSARVSDLISTLLTQDSYLEVDQQLSCSPLTFSLKKKEEYYHSFSIHQGTNLTSQQVIQSPSEYLSPKMMTR